MSILDLFLVLTTLCAVLIALYILQGKTRTPPDHKSSGNRGNWDVKEVTKSVEWGTPCGFKASYRVTATIRRIDDAEFHHNNMDEERNWCNPLRTYWTFRQALLEPYGPWTLHYTWGIDGEPGVFVYSVARGDGESTWTNDPGASRLIEAANKHLESRPVPELYYGCSVHIDKFEPLFDDDLVRENMKMIKPFEHQQAERDIGYLRAQEVAVIKALQLRLDLAQKSDTHRCSRYTIQVSVVGTTVMLSWKRHERWGDKRLLGFRRDGGFNHDAAYDEKGLNGQPIVDVGEDGTCTDHPTPGQTHYYTFFVREPMLFSDTHYRCDLVRFAVHVPARSDVESLKAILEKSQVARRADDEAHRKRDAILRDIDFAIGKKAALINYRNQKIAEVRASSAYSQSEQQELIDAILDEVKDAETFQ